MYIQTEETPNPEALKFIPGVEVMPKGTAAYASLKDCDTSPLAKKLFTLEEVKGIFLGRDFLSITKDPEANWDILKTEIIAIIMDHLVAGGEIYVEQDKKKKEQNKAAVEDSEIVKQIKELLEERVRPAVAMDGGDIIFHEFVDGVVYLEMHGACSGCPSSSVTLKNGVESMLKHFIPEIIKVEEV